MSGIIKMLSSVRNYVYLQTPYFMPNESFMLALKSAALSGADVRLMIPEQCDNKIAGYASRSYLGDLLEVGVKVYLYKDGFIHSKSIVCDDYISSVGSVNLDYRSFYYNFEVSAFVYDKSVAQELKNYFYEDIKHCRQLTYSEYRNRSFGKRCVESCARLLSPLM
jgi:cardiolipin synthase